MVKVTLTTFGPAAVGVIFDVVREGNICLDRGETAAAEAALTTVRDLSGALGLNLYPDSQQQSEDEDGVSAPERKIARIRASTQTGVPIATATIRVGQPDSSDDATVQQLIDERDVARRARDYATADRIRDELADLGVELEDAPGGTIWRRVR